MPRTFPTFASFLAVLVALLALACGGGSKRDVRGFLVAAETGDLRSVQDHLATGVGPDDTLNVGDRTALYYAAINVRVEVVRVLLDAGADPLRQFEGLGLKADVRAFRELVKKAEREPDFQATYKKQDGTIADIRTLRVADEDFDQILRMIDHAIAKQSVK
jgi:hypothetical protein